MFAMGSPSVFSLHGMTQRGVGGSPRILALASSFPSNSLFLVAVASSTGGGATVAAGQEQRDKPSLLLWNSRAKACIGEVGDCEEATASRCQIAWRTTGTQVAVLWTTTEGRKALQIYHVELSDSPLFNLANSDWDEAGMLSVESLFKFGNLKRMKLPSTQQQSWINENVLCISSSRSWLVCGTRSGTIARINWQGELIDEFSLSMQGLFVEELKDEEVPSLESAGSVVCVASKIRGRLFGYVTSSGSSFLVVLPNSERSGSPNQEGLFAPLGIARLHTQRSTVIALSEGRPYVSVGLIDGTVEIHGVCVFTTEHGTVAIEHTHLRTLPCQASASARVESITWCPDSPSDCFAIGYIEQSEGNGSAAATTSPGRSETTVGLLSVWTSGGICLSSGVGGGNGLTWGPQGYSLFYSSPSNIPNSTLFAQEFIKCCGSSLSSLRTSPWLRTCVQSTDSLHILRGQDWDQDVLSWVRLEIPRVYLNRNWPIISVAASPNGSNLVIAGIRGCTVYSLRSKRWRIFGSIQQEQSIVGAGVFWINNKVFAIVHADISSRTYSLLCYPCDHLDNSSLLCRLKLPGRPIAADMDATETTLVILVQTHTRPFVYRVQFQDASPQQERSLVIAQIPFSPEESLPDSISAEKGSTSDETPRPLGVISLIALPFGGSRRAGEPTKFPRCVTLDAIGRIHLVDTENGTRVRVTGINERSTYQIWSFSWRHLQYEWFAIGSKTPSENGDNGKGSPRPTWLGSPSGSMENDDARLWSPTASASASRRLVTQSHHHDWPTVVRHVVWVADRDVGVRLWLPALDEMAETLDKHGVVALDAEVYPVGVHPRLGVLMALSTAPGAAIPAQVVGPFASSALRCSEIRTHIRPCLQGLLMWLIRAHRTDIARDVVSLASKFRFPLFPEALEFLLHEALEEEFAFDREQRALLRGGPLGSPSLGGSTPSSIRKEPSLERKRRSSSSSVTPHESSLVGQVVSLLKYCPFPIFASVVMNCARTVENSRWGFIFPLAGRPEDLFELCCGEAAVEMARNNNSSLSNSHINDYQGGDVTNEVRALLHIAAGYLPLIQDQNLDALNLRMRKLRSMCEEINDLELSVEVAQYVQRRQNL